MRLVTGLVKDSYFGVWAGFEVGSLVMVGARGGTRRPDIKVSSDRESLEI